MKVKGLLALAAAGVVALTFAVTKPATATDLVYGSWPPPAEYLNRVALPKVIKMIDEQTKGEIKWKVVPGGQLADPKATFQAIQEGLMASGLEISTYVPNLIPSVNTMYLNVVFENDPAAATGAAIETLMLHCPSCLEEFKRINTVPLGGWTSSPYLIACTKEIKTPEEFKGKRVRATGGAADLMQTLGAVPVAATLPEATGLLQRGGLDCVFGVNTWLKAFGYGDFAKFVIDVPLGLTGPAIGLPLNRDVWNKLTPDQKKVHLRAAAEMDADILIGQFIVENEATIKEMETTKGVKWLKVDPKPWLALADKFDKEQRKTILADSAKFGVKEPEKILDSYKNLLPKWREISKKVGHDSKKLADAMWDEIFSKVDISKL